MNLEIKLQKGQLKKILQMRLTILYDQYVLNLHTSMYVYVLLHKRSFKLPSGLQKQIGLPSTQFLKLMSDLKLTILLHLRI